MTPTTKPGLHPVLWVAAIAVTVFSLAGLAQLTGLMGKPAERGNLALATAVEPPAQPERLAAAAGGETLRYDPRAAPGDSGPRRESPSSPTAGHVRAQVSPDDGDATPVSYCAHCGVVESVRQIQASGEGTGLGAIAGGVVGGVLGNQVGKGSGNAVATIAGAVAGGYAGHQVEKRVRTSTQYEIAVRMDDGQRRVLTRKSAPTWRQGDRVEVGPQGELTAPPPSHAARGSF
ncbi:MAG: glycine zipper 2TM domain-containing protein [Zoogloeaceae bacterium]|nr:glycine zipper 2TM domain-containing protein [Zoogloeaceae bacterium]